MRDEEYSRKMPCAKRAIVISGVRPKVEGA
jgi:hypothetical protein